jgi:hypothetical protein
MDTNHIYLGSDARAPQRKLLVYLPYPAGASFAARSSRRDGESRRHLDRPSALPAILTTRIRGSMTMMSTTGALSLRMTMTAIAIPPQRPHRRLCRIRIGWPPLSLLPTASLIHPPRRNRNRNRHQDSPGGGRRGGGGACLTAPPHPSCGLRHVPNPIGRRVATLVFQQGGQICAASVVGLHLEGGDRRE